MNHLPPVYGLIHRRSSSDVLESGGLTGIRALAPLGEGLLMGPRTVGVPPMVKRLSSVNWDVRATDRRTEHDAQWLADGGAGDAYGVRTITSASSPFP